MDDRKQLNLLEKNEKNVLETVGNEYSSRRDFLKTMSVLTGGGITFGGWLVETVDAQQRVSYGLVVVDFNKCTGCRTCEAACSQVSRKVTVDGEEQPGLGNPVYTNVRVMSFNPPVDIPNRCVQCSDAPCIESCPVPPDATTGRKALYRNEKTQAVTVDSERCIGCGTCAKTCKELRVGAIIMNSETNQAGSICHLCDGDPACVKYCPFGALTYVQRGLDGRHYASSPEKIAEQLTTMWYYEQ
ncbi:4Fe-4S dicluster domain-containing protein [Candidatus Latescibacterota bacterium]